jgi:hypothetical protein
MDSSFEGGLHECGGEEDRKIVVVEEEAERVFGAWQHNRLMASLS